MAENLSVESPDFDRIRKGNPYATEDAMRLLWFVTNDEIAKRRKADRQISERVSPKVLPLAPTASQNNLDTQGCGLLEFTGTSAINITGIMARTEGDILLLHNTGSGTITFKHGSGSSDATNQLLFASGADKAVATDKSLVLLYLNLRWRELSLA